MPLEQALPRWPWSLVSPLPRPSTPQQTNDADWNAFVLNVLHRAFELEVEPGFKLERACSIDNM